VLVRCSVVASGYVRCLLSHWAVFAVYRGSGSSWVDGFA